MMLLISIISIAQADEAEPFTIAVLPDTQYYCDVRHKLSAKWQAGDLRRYFFAQTQWIHDSQERLNTAFAVHVGDIVQTDVPEDWEIAREAMSTIEGKIPYALCLGNHDMGYRKTDTNRFGCEIAMDRSTRFNEYFPRKLAAQKSEFGGSFHPQRHDNSWYHFEAAGMKFMVLSLEFNPA